MLTTTKIGLAAIPVVATAAAIAIGSGAEAQNPTTRTIVLKELDKGSAFKHVRNTRGASRQSNLTGDILVITHPLADATGKVVGRLHGTCITTVGSRSFEKATASCNAVVKLTDGMLYGQFSFKLSDTNVGGVVTGGTGAYANARGTVLSKTVQGGAQDTFTLIS